MRGIVARGVLALAVFYTTACEKAKLQEHVVEDQGPGILSDRWVGRTKAVVVVKLKKPPLLTGAEKRAGQWVVNPEAKAELKAEQDEVIEALLDLSSDIQILYRYQFVVNGFAAVVPVALLSQISQMNGVVTATPDSSYQRPNLPAAPLKAAGANLVNNPIKFIGADKVHQMTIQQGGGDVPLTGRGIRVGVVDTGVDFTHSMLGGIGTEAAYKSVDVAQPTAMFPNGKVVGGIDLVGSAFNSASLNEDRLIPHPDTNPIDQGGHGTHVAGTVAGIGDGVNSYSGVAPEASIYAIQVFGKNGSTSLSVLLAAFEYSADPNQDGDPSDRLDVVNLSLGSPYGWSRRYEGEAIESLTRIGSVIVNSAGNSGDNWFIVGGMSVNDAALSVAASIDDSYHNVHFPAVAFSGPDLNRIIVERIEGTIGKSIDEGSAVQGKLVDVGLATEDLSEALAAAVKGNVALIERGQVTFLAKAERAQKAGAIGVVIVNNVAGDPVAPGGDGKVDIPVVAIRKESGDLIRNQMKTADVMIEFVSPETIDRPDRIDNIASFSSRGPRSYDAHLKPDIAAPGEAVISADVGKGTAAVKMSGTSMAAPVMSGAMALLRQAHPDLSVQELKNLVVGTAKVLNLPMSRQGGGRVQIDRAVASTVVANRPSISLGHVQLSGQKQIDEEFTFKNLRVVKGESQQVTWAFESKHPALRGQLSAPRKLENGDQTIGLSLKLISGRMKADLEELEGYVQAIIKGEVVYRIPVFAVAKRLSQLKVSEVKVAADSALGAENATTKIGLENMGAHAGEAWLFNLIQLDGRKPNRASDSEALNACDLEAAGYRIVEKMDQGKLTPFLQVAAKIYSPVSSFNQCELTVLIGDPASGSVPRQELARIPVERLKGLETPQTKGQFASVLMDAGTMRKIRKQAEDAAKTEAEEKEPNYTPAVQAVYPSSMSFETTVQFVEAPLHLLVRDSAGALSVQIATLLEDESTTEQDDFLGVVATWIRISDRIQDQSFVGLPEILKLAPWSKQNLTVKKGYGNERLMALFPQNASTQSVIVSDRQMETVAPEFAGSF